MNWTGGRTLEYGRVTRVSKRHIAWCLLTAAIVMACLWAIPAACKQVYWYDYIGVQQTLEDIPDVRVDSINGFDDGIQFKVIDAEVSLLSAPTKTVLFHSPTASELRRGSRLRVDVAEFGFGAITEEGQVRGLELGGDGVFANLLPFEVGSAEEVVRRYDDIVVALGRLPPSGLHRGKDGVLYWYEIRPRGMAAPKYSDMWKACLAAMRERQQGRHRGPSTVGTSNPVE